MNKAKALFWAYILLISIAESLLIIGAIIIGYSFLEKGQFIKSFITIMGLFLIVLSVIMKGVGEIVKKDHLIFSYS